MAMQSTDFVPFSRPSIGADEIAAVTRVLESGWLTTGPEAHAFEAEFAAAVGAPHALAVSSATAGLHLALEALGIGAGTRVICPSLTFTATAEVARYLGADVRFADVGADSLLVDPESIQQRLEEADREGVPVRALIPVHLAGEVCDMGRIGAIAASRGIPIVEDAAHAFPSPTAAGFAGTIGAVGVYSFYATKTITTGEGGMVCTGDEALARRMAIMRLHGIDRDAWERHRGSDESWRYAVVAPGFKYNMPDIAAALGRVQLAKAEDLAAARRRIATRYAGQLADLERAGLLRLPRESGSHAWHLYVVRVPRAVPGGRDRLAAVLRHRGIGSSVHYVPLHHMPYWASHTPAMPLPHTDDAFAEILSLPLYPDLGEDDQARVIEALHHWAAEVGDA